MKADTSTALSESLSTSRVSAWSFTFLLMILYLLNTGDKILLGIVAQPLREEFGFTSAEIGLAGSLFFAAMIGGGFAAGAVNKWLSLKIALAALAIIWALTLIPMVVAGGLAVLFVTRFLLGLAEGPSHSLILTSTYSWHPLDKRALPGAVITAGSSFAKIALAPGLAILVVTFGWRSAFIAMAAFSVVWCVVWLTTWRPGPFGEDAAHNAGHVEKATTSLVPWTAIFRTRTFVCALAAAFAGWTLQSVVLIWLPSYFELGLGFSRLQAGSMFGIPSICSLIFMLLTSLLGDKLMSRGVSSRIHRGILPGALLLGCGVALASLSLFENPLTVVLVFSLGFGLCTSMFPLLYAAISEVAPKAQLAGTLGAFLAIMNAGGLFGPSLTGLLIDSSTSARTGYEEAFLWIGVVALVGALVAISGINPKRDAMKLKAKATVTTD